MRIGVDAGCLGVKDKRLKVGVYAVVKNLLVQLGKQDKKNDYLLYSFYPIEKEVLQQFGTRMKNVVVKPSRGWLTLWLPLQLFKDRPRLFLALNQAMPHKFNFLSYKTIGLFYDIAFEKYPELYDYAASSKKHKMQSRKLAKQADMLVAISENTKKDIVSTYAISKKKVLVAYPGINQVLISSKHTVLRMNRSKKENPYLLFVGAFKKSKNIPMLIKAFALFSKNCKKTYDLLLAGGDKWLDPEIQNALSAVSPTTRQHIKALGFIGIEKLVTLYKEAVAFVSPSLYEGFGLPFLEAQSMQCPVIASTRGSLPEILRGSALLVDPKNVKELVDMMRKITENKALRGQLIKKGVRNSKQYTWEKFGKSLYTAIQHYE